MPNRWLDMALMTGTAGYRAQGLGWDSCMFMGGSRRSERTWVNSIFEELSWRSIRKAFARPLDSNAPDRLYLPYSRLPLRDVSSRWPSISFLFVFLVGPPPHVLPSGLFEMDGNGWLSHLSMASSCTPEVSIRLKKLQIHKTPGSGTS
jgi:hypothetical protein